MPTRFSKTRKARGNVSAGYGRVGKHRKSPGGRGLAGGQHHHRINMDKYHPGFFGKVGQRYFHKTNNQYWKPTINVEKLRSLLPAEELNTSGDLVPVIDLTKLGYAKVLGNCRSSKGVGRPVIVKARHVSKSAEKKIKEAGGVVKIVA